MFRKIYLLASFIVSIFLWSSIAMASCGLAGCPVGSHGENSGTHLFDQAIRYVNFDLEHHDGHYIQYEPRYEYRGWERFIVGGFVSFITLDDGHDSNSGLGNPVLFGQYDFVHEKNQVLSFGSQLELALGDDEDGLAAEHTELVPYLSYTRATASFGWMASLGYRHALDSNDGHGHGATHTHLFVSPHEDKEFLYRLHAQIPNLTSQLTPEIFFDGQHALDGDDDGKGFLSAGAGLRYSPNPGLSITPKIELPVSKPKRFESKYSVHAMVLF